MAGIGDFFGGGINSNTIKNPFGTSGVGNIGLSFGENGPSISANFNNLLRKKMKGTNVNPELAGLFKKPLVAPIMFPSDLDDEHYILIKIKDRIRASAQNADKSRTFHTIVLPVPSNLQVNYSLDYSQESLGILGGLAAGKGGSAEKVFNDLKGLLGAKATAVGSMLGIGDNDASEAQTQQVQDQLAAIGLAGVATALGGKVGGGLGAILTAGAVGADQVGNATMMSTGVAINPHLAQMFKGVGLREFSFDWKLVPRSQQEAETIKSLVTTLKRYAHPKYFAGGYAFDYPAEFELEFADSIASSLFKINRSVLKNISVDYGAEGTPLFFDDGAPVSTKLTLQFQETKIMTAEDFGGWDADVSAGGAVENNFNKITEG